MNSLRHLLVLSVMLCVAAPWGAALAQTHVTATGAEAPTPPIDELDCAQMKGVLAEIDATGYRRGGPDSAAESDRPLLDYENRLSERYFGECVRSGDAGDAALDGALAFAAN